VLLIAGANVSGLLLVRAAERETEFAVRKALGASHGRLLSQMLTEALILAVLGIIAGWVLGEVLLRVFINLSPRSIPYMDQARLDGRVLAFAVAIALFSALLFGSSPLWARDLWREKIFRNTCGTARPRLRQTLLVAQLSVTLMLLAAAGLLLRSARNLQNQAFGIHTDQLVTATVHFSARAYPNGTKRMQFVDRLEERLKQIPGVNAVAVSDSVPPGGLEHDRIIGVIAVEGNPRPEGGTGGNTVWRWVTPDYFSIFGIPITRGSGFTEEERESNDHVLILSEAMAERLFSGEYPIGKHVDLHEADANNPWYTVVGVAANAKNGGLVTESEPEYYKLWRNRPEDWNSFFVGANGGEIATFTLSTAANPKALASLVRSEAASIDNSVPVDFETIRQRISTMAEGPRFEAALLSLFAALALVLAAVGLYGVIAFIVSRRTQEIAVRVALGAGKQQIAALIGGDGIKMIGTGIFFGSLGAIAVTRTFRSLLFGVSANDLLTLVCSVVVLLAISALAMWIPVWRALRVDPMQALRYE
jgi:predicted permease